jgi:hypothetical protein
MKPQKQNCCASQDEIICSASSREFRDELDYSRQLWFDETAEKEV